jgi:hypothetical protein
MFKGLVYVFWPTTSRSIGPDDIDFFNSATASNTFLVIKTLTRAMLSAIVYFHSGLIFFRRDEKLKPLNILAGIYLAIYLILLLFWGNDSQNLQLKVLLICGTLFVIFYYRILRSKYYLENNSTIKNLWALILEIPWVSSFLYRTKKIAYYLFEKTFGIIAAVYVVVAHIYFFVVLYGYWQLNGFDNIFTTGIMYSLWKAVFWMFYIW